MTTNAAIPHDRPEDDLVVTGANGQLGRALLTTLCAPRSSTADPTQPAPERRRIRALVRSERARHTIEALGLDPAPRIQIVDYTSPSQMIAALEGARAVVHLVGIIKETASTRYVETHEQTCHALGLAADRAGLSRIVYLSILGSKPSSENACLASKGRAESILLEDRVATTVLRVPMVLGGNDPASASLRRQAQARSLRLVNGGRTLQQPIDARDVVRAIIAATAPRHTSDVVLDAGGPESLSHRNLVLRAARLYGNTPRIRSLPGGLARFGVGLLDRLLRNPPVTRAMFDILQHDDRIDPARFCQKLGLELTPLDQTLAELIGPESEFA